MESRDKNRQAGKDGQTDRQTGGEEERWIETERNIENEIET